MYYLAHSYKKTFVIPVGIALLALLAAIPLAAAPTTTQSLIRLDQFGYLPDMKKVAVISNPQIGFNSTDSYTPNTTLEIRTWVGDAVVYSGSI
ncbi:MAG: cellulase N-terminal Ig-like domain-containing protein, partial [Bacteroidota bacterium]